MAFSDELEQWKVRIASETAQRKGKEEPAAPARRRRLPWLILLSIIVVAIAVAIAVYVSHARAKPSQWSLERDTFQVMDPQGTVLWSLQLPAVEPDLYERPMRRLGDAWLSENARIDDFDGNGSPELILIVRQPGISDELRCYDAAGEPRWTFQFGRDRHVGSRFFENVYLGRLFIGPLLGRDGRRYVLAYGEQGGFYPAQLVLLDASDGTVCSEYWHPGYMSRYSFLLEDLDGDGFRELMAGGFNNPEQGPGYAALVVLGIPFKKPQPEIRNIFGDPAGQEEAYLLFSRPDIWNVKEETPFLNELFPADGTHFRATIFAASGDSHYRLLLDRQLNVVEARAGDQLARIHQDLYLQGLLDHKLNESEVESWKRVLHFRSAPNGNGPEVRLLWEKGDSTSNATQN